jgi:hypothetical protein
MKRIAEARHILVSSLAALTIFLAPLDLLGGESYRIERRITPAGYEPEAQFLELLKYPNPPEREFHVEDAPRWDIEVLKKYLPEGRIVFTDVNDSSRVEANRSTVETSLKTRNGRTFDVLSHLSHIYSLPYRQYSELRFSSPAPNTSVVQVSGWYRLTFQKSPQGAKLKQVDYLMWESH